MRERDISAGFAILTTSSGTIEDNLSDIVASMDHYFVETFREWERQGLIEGDVITEKGWDVLTDDSLRLERNCLAWLRKTFDNALDEGHGGHDGEELIGTFWFDPTDTEQMEWIHQGTFESIRMLEHLPNAEAEKLLTGLSKFGYGLLDAEIQFFNVPQEILDQLN